MAHRYRQDGTSREEHLEVIGRSQGGVYISAKPPVQSDTGGLVVGEVR